MGGSSTNLNIAPHGTVIIEGPNVGQLNAGLYFRVLAGGLPATVYFARGLREDTSYVTAVAVGKATLSLASHGHAQTETLPAFSGKEYRGIVASL